MNFQESVDYLYGLGNEVLAMKLGLENIRKLLAALGNPEKKYLKVQIAGTNGKGSTCAFLEAICVSAEIETGLMTSPHLVSITERIKINGAEISENKFAKYATKIRETSEDLVVKKELETVPTFFEQVTAIAIYAFAEAGVELAILETGLGGRFDAATAADAEIVGITPIDFDHQKFLGDTLEEITAEKAATIRKGTKAVISNQKPEALKVIKERCREVSVLPIINDCSAFEVNSPEISFKTINTVYSNVKLNLLGEHQRENACTAISLAEILIQDFSKQISRQNIIKGLETAKHSGRLEWQTINNVRVLFDGAHNVAGAKALKHYLQKNFADSKIAFIFGTMNDKNSSEIGKILFPMAENLILTMPDNPRSESIEELRKYAEKLLAEKNIFLIPNVKQAINSSIQISSNSSHTQHAFVCVTGSLYLVGEAKKIIKNEYEV